MFKGKNVLITGGTGSFGHTFVRKIINDFKFQKIIIYSRDEYKQYLMQQEFKDHQKKLRFFIGDVRDRNRLYRAFDGVNMVIHAAALKHVPLMEYNPMEAVKTNIEGAQNIVDAAIDRGVEKVVALSTDKAVNPVNLYGATKLVSDKLFTAAQAYSGTGGTVFSVVRYGNVSGSRGSIIPYFISLKEKGEKVLPITDFRMTRFWITLNEGVNLVLKALTVAMGGEIFISKIPSYKIVDMAKALYPAAELKETGIRPGEKLHESLITEVDARSTYEYDDSYIIYPTPNIDESSPRIQKGGRKVPDSFRYVSNSNPDHLNVEQLKTLIPKLHLS